MNPDTLTKSTKIRESAEPKTVKEKAAAPKPAEEIRPSAKHNDLCLDCIHREECIYRGRNHGPVHDCEDYESSGIPVDRPVEKVARPATLGLCATCENRDHCTLRKPEGGVWHCEEYR